MGKHKRNSMMYETAFLSIFSVCLQSMGLLFNVFLTHRLGAASVGALTLMISFYNLAAVLSGGSGFIAASRFLSEELGCNGNPQKVYRYTMRFCLILSSTCAGLLCLAANCISVRLGRPELTPQTIRLLSISLPVSALMACQKGRCYAYQRVYLPAAAECLEFLVRAGILAFCAIFLIPQQKMSLLTAFGIAAAAGQVSAVLLLTVIRPPVQHCKLPCTFSFGRFIRLMLPVMGNACLVALLNSTNDALVPLTLLQYGSSTEEAMSQFGEFEAIIIPTLFFPSVIQCCMAGLLVPELSRARSAGDEDSIRMLTERVLEQTVSYALFVVLVLMRYGGQLGFLLGGDAFTGKILRCMAPVVPFIYLEILLEGILRGLGKQNYSSANYLAEYLVRISVLLICVPMFGFYGIAASYMACNLTGNAVRLYLVLRLTGLKPVWKKILVRPLFALLLSDQLVTLLKLLLTRIPAIGCLPEIPLMMLFMLLCGAVYYFVLCSRRRHNGNYISR